MKDNVEKLYINVKNSQLANHITHYFILRSEESCFLPDINPGTGAEIWFNFGDDFHVESSSVERVVKKNETFIVCPRKQNYKINSNGKLNVFVLRLTAIGFFEIFNVPVSDIADTLNGLDSFVTCNTCIEVFEKQCFHEVAELLEQRVIEEDIIKHDAVMADAVNSIYNSNEFLSFEELSDRLPMSARTFQRKFLSYTGVSAKLFHKLARTERALKVILKDKNTNINDVIVDFGYYDYSHFLKEFKRVVKSTPSKWLSDQIYKTNFYSSHIYQKYQKKIVI